jgi:hypothetical protein
MRSGAIELKVLQTSALLLGYAAEKGMRAEG